ncbi:MAG: 2-oxo acid dehydrogenase subunit E2, partial [Candidatus Diapherotrites archaeon]|nr:2-oxo acid dehydrogenase subunit E2 [Candidatus Diapherotrites archaeon]
KGGVRLGEEIKWTRPADKVGSWTPIFGYIIEEASGETRETMSPIPATSPPKPEPREPTVLEKPAPAKPDLPKASLPDETSGMPQVHNRPLAAPRVRRVAKERGIDLVSVEGSGPNGTITLSDLEKFSSRENPRQAEHRDDTENVSTAPAETDAFVIEPVGKFDLRNAIASNMELSARCIPHASTDVCIDFRRILEAHRLLEWMASQGEINLDLARKYLRPEIIVIEGMLRALGSKHRKLNSVWGCEHFDFRGLKVWKSINLGIAYQTPRGLLVPVLKGMEGSPYRVIGDRLFDLYERMERSAVPPAEFKNGTVTFNNVGAIGGDGGKSIIVHGQSAICSLHRVERDIASPFYGFTTLGTSFDHRP